jgi:hypothetical protein
MNNKPALMRAYKVVTCNRPSSALSKILFGCLLFFSSLLLLLLLLPLLLQRTISREGGGDGDDWVEKKEFKQLLVNLFYFNRLWKAFDGIDTGENKFLGKREEEKRENGR